MTIRTKLLALSAAAMMATTLVSTSALAGDSSVAAPQLKVESSTDYYVKAGAKAFKKGDFNRSIAYSNKALDKGLSSKREAIAYSNLCAAHGALNETAAAAEACDKALVLRPDYKPALNNQAGLRTLLAQK